ncbi:MAG: hypothetical protein DA407_09285 [Bacteroidetes bacterium]|nr:MAG: hypothetical protein DA407_09285 [Bacteroidota bacterium]
MTNYINSLKDDKSLLPQINSFYFDSTGTILSIELELEPNHEYNFTLPGSLYYTKGGYKLDDFIVKFRTGS